jgi:hypothetical protein
MGTAIARPGKRFERAANLILSVSGHPRDWNEVSVVLYRHSPHDRMRKAAAIFAPHRRK